MAERQELQVVLRTVAQGQGAQQTAAGLRQVRQEQAASTTQTQAAISSAAKWVGALALVDRALTAAIDIYRASIDAQRENERVTRATAAAYGANAQQFTRFAESLSTATGFTSQAILEAALSARTLSTNYGLTIQQTQNLIRASADLARIRGIGVAEAFERVQSAIRGESEASEYLGLTLNDTFIKNNALNGSVKTTFERMTDAQKAQIRYTELLRQAAAFSGIAAGSTNSLDGAFARAALSGNKLALTLGEITKPGTIAGLRGLTAAAESLNTALHPDPAALDFWRAVGETLRGGGQNIPSVPGRVLAARRDAATQERQVAVAAEEEIQRDILQRNEQAARQRELRARAEATRTQSRLRQINENVPAVADAGTAARVALVIKEQAFLDQRDAAVRDLLAAQREELDLKTRLTDLEKQQGDMVARRAQVELASIAAQQRALPAQQALADTERSVERARLVLGIRGTSIEERRAARGTIREAERNVLPGQRLAAFDVETGVIAAQRQEQAFDLSARVTQIAVDQAMGRQEALIAAAAARVDAQQQVLGQIMQQAIEDGFLKRPPQSITIQILGPSGEVSYEEIVEAADQAGMPPVIRVSGVRR